jgi:hypothetical protein
MLLVMLGGCATLSPAGGTGDSVRRLVERPEKALREMVAGLQDPVRDDALAAADAALAEAQLAVAAEVLASAGAPGTADLAGAGVVLRLCREGVARISGKLPDRGAAVGYARGGFVVTCLAPLGVLTVR